jgi:hypothetical protein
VQRVIASASLPDAPDALAGHVHGTVTFSSWRASTSPRPQVRFAGIVPQIAIRRGQIETTGFRANTMFEVGRERVLRWLLGGAAEFAGADTGKPAYAGRALVGVVAPVVRRFHFVALVGAGIRDFGTNAPRAGEAVMEERIIIPIGKLRLHGTLEYSTASGYGYGLAASVPIAGVRMYGGAQVDELRETVMFMLGAAIGEAY